MARLSLRGTVGCNQMETKPNDANKSSIWDQEVSAVNESAAYYLNSHMMIYYSNRLKVQEI